MTRSYCPVLSIAGSDSSGGAGIQADIKTIASLGCYAMTAITAITAQNTTAVADVEGISPEMVVKQIAMTVTDIPPRAVKTGMLFSTHIIEAVAAALRRFDLTNVVVDPVMVSTSGSMLIAGENVAETFRKHLIPAATLITPNVHEAVALTGCRDTGSQLRSLHMAGCPNVLLKGGDRSPDEPTKTDLLSLNHGERVIELSSPTVATRNTHGTGCTLSSAIASFLAMGSGVEEAVRRAKEYIDCALRAGADVATGSGHGPVNHFFNPLKQHIFDES